MVYTKWNCMNFMNAIKNPMMKVEMLRVILLIWYTFNDIHDTRTHAKCLSFQWTNSIKWIFCRICVCVCWARACVCMCISWKEMHNSHRQFHITPPTPQIGLHTFNQTGRDERESKRDECKTIDREVMHRYTDRD